MYNKNMNSKHTLRLSGYLNKDGTLKIVRWAEDAGVHHGHQHLHVSLGERRQHLAHSIATGEGLVSNGFLGGDIIRLAAGEGFVPHTHPGDHLLVIIGGKGTVTYGGVIYPAHAGQIFMIEGKISHAVGAITDCVILAVGSPHKSVDDPDRMTPVEYEEVITDLKELHCLICDIVSTFPQRPHDVGCPHCPCYDCVKITSSKSKKT